jgi:hypothetical protein
MPATLGTDFVDVLTFDCVGELTEWKNRARRVGPWNTAGRPAATHAKTSPGKR